MIGIERSNDELQLKRVAYIIVTDPNCNFIESHYYHMYMSYQFDCSLALAQVFSTIKASI